MRAGIKDLAHGLSNSSGVVPLWRQHFYLKNLEFLWMFPLGFVHLELLVTLYFAFFAIKKKNCTGTQILFGWGDT